MPDIIAIIVLIAVLVFWAKAVQRALAILDKNINNAISQISVQLSSQWNCLAALLNLTVGNDTFDFPALTEGIKERRSITIGSPPEGIEHQKTIIAEMVKSIMAAAEGYSELRANPDYVTSMDTVKQYGKMINTSSLIYNESVTRLNRAIRRFPSSMIAGSLGFSKRVFLKEVEDGSWQTPV